MTEPLGVDDLSRRIVECAERLGQFQKGTIGERIDAVTSAARIGAWLIAQEQSPKRCPGCRHAPHAPNACFNMASDNECSCTVGTEP